MSKLIIAIDPDVERSGVAMLSTETRGYVFIESLTFHALMTILQTWSTDRDHHVQVIVEAGYLNASHWHIANAKSKAMAAQIGNATGRNHEVARKIVEMCRDFFHLEVEEVKPLKKTWHGKDGKISHDELCNLTGLTRKRTNQDERDAALLAWYYSDLPMIIKPKVK